MTTSVAVHILAACCAALAMSCVASTHDPGPGLDETSSPLATTITSSTALPSHSRSSSRARTEVFNTRADLASGKLRRVLPTHSVPGGGLYALFPSARHVPHKVRVFVDFLVEQLRAR